jgi:hypothetical protein
LDDDSFSDTETTQELDRALQVIRITATVSGTDTILWKTAPKYLQIEEITVETVAWGAKVTIITNGYGWDREYSIINTAGAETVPTVWSSNREFVGVTPGDYTGYVKDEFDCIRSKTFTVTEEPDLPANYNVPQKMMVSLKSDARFTKRTIPSTQLTSGNFNFLSKELPEFQPVKNFKHIFAKGQDSNYTFKSSYPGHKVTVIECVSTEAETPGETDVTVTKMTDNIQRHTYLEALFDEEPVSGNLRISFEPGDVYNANGDVIGTHSYDGTLPAFYQEGTEVRINGVASTIYEIDTSTSTSYAVTYINYNSETGGTVESVHQVNDHEDWMFTIDYNTAPTKFYIKIEAHKSTVTEEVGQTWISELIEVKENADFTAGRWHVVESWSTKPDAEVNYSLSILSFVASDTIKHLHNIEFLQPLRWVPNNEIESEKLDYKVERLDSKSMTVFETRLKPVAAPVAEAIAHLFANTEYHNIDGTLYTCLNVTIDGENQLRTPKATLAVVSMTNELDVVAPIGGFDNVNEFYPVKT